MFVGHQAYILNEMKDADAALIKRIEERQAMGWYVTPEEQIAYAEASAREVARSAATTEANIKACDQAAHENALRRRVQSYMRNLRDDSALDALAIKTIALALQAGISVDEIGARAWQRYQTALQHQAERIRL